MWGPYFGHKRAIFWPFLGEGHYEIHPELWNLVWSIPRHIDYESGRTNWKDHVRTMFWPYKGHILAVSRKMALWDTPRIVKFGMEHPGAHWIWFRNNQYEGPCEDHVLAIKGPHFGHFYEKWTMGYTHNCEVQHGPSLGTLIMIQEEPIWKTLWGPRFGHKRAIFWPFLEKVDYGINPELWNLAWSIPRHIDYNSGNTNLKDHVRTMFWP